MDSSPEQRCMCGTGQGTPKGGDVAPILNCHTHACIHAHVCMHTHMYMYIHAYTHMHTHTDTHTYVHTRMHTHTRTHTHRLSDLSLHSGRCSVEGRLCAELQCSKGNTRTTVCALIVSVNSTVSGPP